MRRYLTAMLLVALAACTEADGQPSPPRGAPRAPAVAMELATPTDSTADLTVTWTQVSPPADAWRVRLAVAGDTVAIGQADSTALVVGIPRVDSVYAETACVWGLAVRGPETRSGDEGCASVNVPARPLETPGTPSPGVSLDTVDQTAQLPEMPADVQVAEVGRTDSTITYEATWTCAEGAEQYIVRAGSDDGSRTYVHDTLSAGDCIAGETVTRRLAARLPTAREDMLDRCRATGACR